MIHWGLKKSAHRETVYVKCDFSFSLGFTCFYNINREDCLTIVPDLFFLTSSFKLSLGYPNLLSETIRLPFLVARLLCKFSLYKKVEQFTLSYFSFCYLLKYYYIHWKTVCTLAYVTTQVRGAGGWYRNIGVLECKTVIRGRETQFSCSSIVTFSTSKPSTMSSLKENIKRYFLTWEYEKVFIFTWKMDESI